MRIAGVPRILRPARRRRLVQEHQKRQRRAHQLRRLAAADLLLPRNAHHQLDREDQALRRQLLVLGIRRRVEGEGGAVPRVCELGGWHGGRGYGPRAEVRGAADGVPNAIYGSFERVGECVGDVEVCYSSALVWGSDTNMRVARSCCGSRRIWKMSTPTTSPCEELVVEKLEDARSVG
jgi:hypothetical protein